MKLKSSETNTLAVPTRPTADVEPGPVAAPPARKSPANVVARDRFEARPAAARAIDPNGVTAPFPQPPVVAIFDDGVDFSHPELAGSAWVNPREVPGNKRDDDHNGKVDDVHGFEHAGGESWPGHGTFVAGVIAGAANGKGNTGIAAGKVQLMAVGNLYSGEDATGRVLLERFEKSVDYVIAQKQAGANVRVVNASFGVDCPDKAMVARWNAAVKKLADHDILLVAAANNGGKTNDTAHMPAGVKLPNVITVANLDRQNDKLNPTSDRGTQVADLAAIGTSVLSAQAGGGFARETGTSFAAPMVAGAAARLFAAKPDLTAAQVRQLLLDSAERDPDLTGLVSSGAKLDVQAALARIGQAPADLGGTAYGKQPATIDGDPFRCAIQKGDTPAAIAKRLGISEKELRAANPHLATNPTAMTPGNVLVVPRFEAYVVRPGDNLTKIVKRLNTGDEPGSLTLQGPGPFNGIKNPNLIRVGQVIYFDATKRGQVIEGE